LRSDFLMLLVVRFGNGPGDYEEKQYLPIK
jgi:hypothetical protein